MYWKVHETLSSYVKIFFCEINKDFGNFWKFWKIAKMALFYPFQQFSSPKLHNWGHTSLDWFDVKNWWTAKARSLTTSIGVLSTSISQVSGNSSIFPTYFWIISTHKSRSVPCLVLTLNVGKYQKVIFIFVPYSKECTNFRYH